MTDKNLLTRRNLLAGVAATTFVSRPTSTLKGALDQIADGFGGTLGYALRHFKTGDALGRRENERFPSASTIKLAVLGEALRAQQAGEIGYYDALPLEERFVRSGAGFLQKFRADVKVEIKELLHLMITVSDNTATVLLIDKLGNAKINAWLDGQHLTKTRLLSRLPSDASPDLKTLAQTYGLGVTTPAEMVALLARLRSGEAGTPAACDEMRRLMAHQYFDDLIAGSVPPGVQVASKSGALNQSRSDVALVSAPSGDYALAVYTQNNVDQQWGRANQAEQAIRAIAGRVWAFYEPDRPYTPPPGTEKF